MGCIAHLMKSQRSRNRNNYKTVIKPIKSAPLLHFSENIESIIIIYSSSTTVNLSAKLLTMWTAVYVFCCLLAVWNCALVGASDTRHEVQKVRGVLSE